MEELIFFFISYVVAPLLWSYFYMHICFKEIHPTVPNVFPVSFRACLRVQWLCPFWDAWFLWPSLVSQEGRTWPPFPKLSCHVCAPSYFHPPSPPPREVVNPPWTILQTCTYSKGVFLGNTLNLLYSVPNPFAKVLDISYLKAVGNILCKKIYSNSFKLNTAVLRPQKWNTKK